MNKEHDDSNGVAEDLRQMLIGLGAEPKDLSPLPGEAERAEERLAAILRSPREESASDGPAEPAKDRYSHLGRSRRLIMLLAAAVVAIGLVAIRPFSGTEMAAAQTPPLLTFNATRPGDMPQAGRPASDILADLARRSRTQTASLPAPVQHVVVDAWWSTSQDAADEEKTHSELIPVQRENFFYPDTTMRTIERYGAPLRKDGALDEQETWAQRPVVSDESFESPDPGPTYADDLPTDPATLRESLTSTHDSVLCSQTPGGCLVEDVINLYHSYVISPSLSGALWEVLSREPSIYYVGTTHDRLGRNAVAFMTRATDGVSQVLVLADPNTGAYLGDEQVLVKKSDAYSFTPPTVTSFSSVVKTERIPFKDVPPAP